MYGCTYVPVWAAGGPSAMHALCTKQNVCIEWQLLQSIYQCWLVMWHYDTLCTLAVTDVHELEEVTTSNRAMRRFSSRRLSSAPIIISARGGHRRCWRWSLWGSCRVGGVRVGGRDVGRGPRAIMGQGGATSSLLRAQCLASIRRSTHRAANLSLILYLAGTTCWGHYLPTRSIYCSPVLLLVEDGVGAGATVAQPGGGAAAALRLSREGQAQPHGAVGGGEGQAADPEHAVVDSLDVLLAPGGEGLGAVDGDAADGLGAGGVAGVVWRMLGGGERRCGGGVKRRGA